MWSVRLMVFCGVLWSLSAQSQASASQNVSAPSNWIPRNEGLEQISPEDDFDLEAEASASRASRASEERVARFRRAIFPREAIVPGDSYANHLGALADLLPDYDGVVDSALSLEQLVQGRDRRQLGYQQGSKPGVPVGGMKWRKQTALHPLEGSSSLCDSSPGGVTSVMQGRGPPSLQGLRPVILMPTAAAASSHGAVNASVGQAPPALVYIAGQPMRIAHVASMAPTSPPESDSSNSPQPLPSTQSPQPSQPPAVAVQTPPAPPPPQPMLLVPPPPQPLPVPPAPTPAPAPPPAAPSPPPPPAQSPPSPPVLPSAPPPPAAPSTASPAMPPAVTQLGGSTPAAAPPAPPKSSPTHLEAPSPSVAQYASRPPSPAPVPLQRQPVASAAVASGGARAAFAQGAQMVPEFLSMSMPPPPPPPPPAVAGNAGMPTFNVMSSVLRMDDFTNRGEPSLAPPAPPMAQPLQPLLAQLPSFAQPPLAQLALQWPAARLSTDTGAATPTGAPSPSAGATQRAGAAGAAARASFKEEEDAAEGEEGGGFGAGEALSAVAVVRGAGGATADGAVTASKETLDDSCTRGSTTAFAGSKIEINSVLDCSGDPAKMLEDDLTEFDEEMNSLRGGRLGNAGFESDAAAAETDSVSAQTQRSRRRRRSLDSKAQDEAEVRLRRRQWLGLEPESPSEGAVQVLHELPVRTPDIGNSAAAFLKAEDRAREVELSNGFGVFSLKGSDPATQRAGNHLVVKAEGAANILQEKEKRIPFRSGIKNIIVQEQTDDGGKTSGEFPAAEINLQLPSSSDSRQQLVPFDSTSMAFVPVARASEDQQPALAKGGSSSDAVRKALVAKLFEVQQNAAAKAGAKADSVVGGGGGGGVASPPELKAANSAAAPPPNAQPSHVALHKTLLRVGMARHPNGEPTDISEGVAPWRPGGSGKTTTRATIADQQPTAPPVQTTQSPVVSPPTPPGGSQGIPSAGVPGGPPAGFQGQQPGQPPGGQPPGGQPPGGQPPSGQPPGGQPPGGQPAGGQPPSGQPPSGQPPGGQPPGGQSPGGQPPGGQPPSPGSSSGGSGGPPGVPQGTPSGISPGGPSGGSPLGASVGMPPPGNTSGLPSSYPSGVPPPGSAGAPPPGGPPGGAPGPPAAYINDGISGGAPGSQPNVPGGGFPGNPSGASPNGSLGNALGGALGGSSCLSGGSSGGLLNNPSGSPGIGQPGPPCVPPPPAVSPPLAPSGSHPGSGNANGQQQQASGSSGGCPPGGCQGGAPACSSNACLPNGQSGSPQSVSRGSHPGSFVAAMPSAPRGNALVARGSLSVPSSGGSVGAPLALPIAPPPEISSGHPQGSPPALPSSHQALSPDLVASPLVQSGGAPTRVFILGGPRMGTALIEAAHSRATPLESATGPVVVSESELPAALAAAGPVSSAVIVGMSDGAKSLDESRGGAGSGDGGGGGADGDGSTTMAAAGAEDGERAAAVASGLMAMDAKGSRWLVPIASTKGRPGVVHIDVNINDADKDAATLGYPNSSEAGDSSSLKDIGGGETGGGDPEEEGESAEGGLGVDEEMRMTEHEAVVAKVVRGHRPLHGPSALDPLESSALAHDRASSRFTDAAEEELQKNGAAQYAPLNAPAHRSPQMLTGRAGGDGDGAAAAVASVAGGGGGDGTLRQPPAAAARNKMPRMRPPRQLRRPLSWERAMRRRVSRGGGGGAAKGKGGGKGDKAKTGGGREDTEEDEENVSEDEWKESRSSNRRVSRPSGMAAAAMLPSAPATVAAAAAAVPEGGEEEGVGCGSGSNSSSSGNRTSERRNKSSEAVEERIEDRPGLESEETLLEKAGRRDKGGAAKQHAAESGVRGTGLNHARNANTAAAPLSPARDVGSHGARDAQKKLMSNKRPSVSKKPVAPSSGSARDVVYDDDEDDDNDDKCKSTTRRAKGQSREGGDRAEAAFSPEDEAAESRSAEEFNEKVELQKALAGDLARRIVESVLKKARSEGQVQKHFKLSADGASDAAIVLNAERRKQMREQEALAQSEHQVLGQVIELLDGLARRTGREQACTRLSPELHGFLMWLLQRGPGDQNAALDDPLASVEGPSASGAGGGIRAPEAFLFNSQQQQQKNRAPAKSEDVVPGKQAHAPAPQPPLASPLPVLSEWNRSPGRGPQRRLHVDDKNARWLALEEREKKLHRMLADLEELPVSAMSTLEASSCASGGWPSVSTPSQADVTREAHHLSWLEAAGAAQRLVSGQAVPQAVEMPPLGRLLQETEGTFGRGRRGASEWSGAAEAAAGALWRRDRRLPLQQQEPLQARRRPARGGPQWPSEEFTRLQELATKLKAQGFSLQ